MCTVSMVTDYGRKDWDIFSDPDLVKTWPRPNQPFNPASPTITVKMPTKEEVEEFYKLLEAARRFDEKTGQADCPDPEKTEWLNRFKELVRELYGHLENEPK